MGNIVSHKGTVLTVDNDTVKVEIESTTACSSCEAKKMCNAHQSQIKIIEVSRKSCNFKPAKGDLVEVDIKTSLAFFALFFAFIVPLILILAVLVLFIIILGFSETTAAATTLLTLTIYYLVLFLSNSLLSRKITFKLRPLN